MFEVFVENRLFIGMVSLASRLLLSHLVNTHLFELVTYKPIYYLLNHSKREKPRSDNKPNIFI